MARFNRHRPALCADCGKPLSVAEKRIAGLCTWDAYMLYRKEFAEISGGFWANDVPEPDTETPPEVFWISEGDLFR